MVPASQVRGAGFAAILALGLLGQLCGATASADAALTSDANNDRVSFQRGTSQQTAAAAPVPTPAPVPTAAPASMKPLWLPKTRSDWDSIADEIQLSAGHMHSAVDGRLEEVTVTAPAELLPMDDVYDEMWGGILAPVWAVMHPTQAWRIFLPVPPR